ncbi:diacylglycerol O-acyltransferase [Rhodococcoides trifolii]|uniref:diacylglycerol O-acyltransferase n=1 Tax=Rhodococcoides trifolii TaxID=908250 RepID=A0A917CUM3_9NOCA|nr:wax ester/triacylglycerol synthase domain-containing protein [Rhodococcus trifolii]GGF97309.1 diacylglycerol O-acyltransferase [Rhodococcus trifolii]
MISKRLISTQKRPESGTPMTGRDALNYYFESPKTRAAVIATWVIDAAKTASPIRDQADAQAFVAEFVDVDPMFRRRLRTVPGNLSFPVWIECQVDLSQHVFTSTPDTPDHARYINDKIAALASSQPRFDIPPWAFHFVLDVHGVDGIPEGGMLIITHSHHSAVDGMGVAKLCTQILGSAPRTVSSNAPLVEVPTGLQAAREVPAEIGRFVSAFRTHSRAVRDRRKALDAAGSTAPKPVKRPATRFSRNLPPDMTYDQTPFDLGRIRAIKSGFGDVTVNDVMMTAISLALSDYLRELGELPTESLGTSIPMSTRSMNHNEAGNANQIAVVMLSLHTDIADPLARLRAVHASAEEAKNRGTTQTTQLPTNPLFVAPAPLLAVLSKLMRHPKKNPTTALINTMITNLAYVRDPLEFRGAPMVGVFGPLPTAEGIQLAHCIASYGPTMWLSVTSNRALMPDTGRYISLIRGAVDRLEEAARGIVDESDAGERRLAEVARHTA